MATLTVHPHVRGEHAFREAAELDGFGSSPRPWGTLASATMTPRQSRFIPTSVGNTRRYRFFSLLTPVHPHVRGEHAALANEHDA